MNLSPHFTFEEMIFSQTAMRKGLNNVPPQHLMSVLRHTCECMEEVRALLGVSIHVSSGYRAPSVNTAIGGSPTSQHPKAEAVDFTAPDFGTPREVALTIINSDIKFDQIIMEGNWVHISFSNNPRGQALTAVFRNGKATYLNGIK